MSSKLTSLKPLEYFIDRSERTAHPDSFAPNIKTQITFSMSLEELEDMGHMGYVAYLPDLYERLKEYFEELKAEQDGNV